MRAWALKKSVVIVVFKKNQLMNDNIVYAVFQRFDTLDV